MDLPGTCQLKRPPTNMETVISPELGRSSFKGLLTSGNQLPAPTTSDCRNEQVVTYQQNEQDAGAAPKYVKQGCYAGGKGGLPGRRDTVQLLIAALFPGEPKFQDTVPKPPHQLWMQQEQPEQERMVGVDSVQVWGVLQEFSDGTNHSLEAKNKEYKYTLQRAQETPIPNKQRQPRCNWEKMYWLLRGPGYFHWHPPAKRKPHCAYPVTVALNSGDFTPQGTCKNVQTVQIVDCLDWESASGTQCEKTGILLNILQCTEQPPTEKTVQNVTSAVAEKPHSIMTLSTVCHNCQRGCVYLPHQTSAV